MLQNIDLRELAQLKGNGRDVVSAYFRGKDGLSRLSNREQVIRDLLQDEPLELENFEASLATMHKLVDESSINDSERICLFASEILDFAKGYSVAMEVPNRLIVGPAPYIRPLAELQDEYETFLVVACDNDRTRMITVTNYTTEMESAIKGNIKNHVRKGGWSQQRYERRRDEQLGNYGDEISDQIRDLVRSNDIHRVVLIGSEETRRAIESQLSDQLRELIVGREDFDLNRPEDEMIELAYESYFDDERQQEQDLWQRIKNETLSDGRGCTGPADTLAAAKIGRVDLAIASRDLRIDVFKCKDCEDVVLGKTDTCRACHSHNTFRIDYLDTLARLLETTSASLNFVDPFKALEKVGDVGALLRY